MAKQAVAFPPLSANTVKNPLYADFSALWEEHYARHTPPPILFHYTSSSGLLGITESRSIYATAVWYLNDATEIGHAAELARQLIDERAASLASREDADSVRSLHRAFGEFLFPDTFVASFSERGDQLSQWRGYCQHGSGYALGFLTADLKRQSERQQFSLLRCIYDVDELRTILLALIDDVISRLGTPVPDGDREKLELTLRLRFLRTFSTLAPTLKHPSFSEEAEWRLVHVDERETAQIEYRSGLHTLIPFVRLGLSDDSPSAHIAELVIGPSPLQQLGGVAAEGYRKCSGLPIDSIKQSAVPFRQV